MRMRPDGSVQSTNVPTYQNIVPREDYNLYRCIVEKVVFVDDAHNVTQNTTNPEVLYNVIIMGGPRAGQKISNCRLSSDLGGNNNFYERVLKASTKKFAKDPLSQHDGDVVFVQFTQGHSGYPVIVACDGGISTAKVIGAKESDGPRLRRKYNGIFEEINKNGEYTFIRHGGAFNGSEFVPSEVETYKKVVSKDEIVEETFISGLNIKKDGKNDKVTITTAEGAIMDIDGKSGKITLTKGSTIIELDGGSDKISLKGGFVDLGNSVSDFAVLLNELLVSFNTHSHQFIDITPGGPITSVTMPPLAPMLASVGSATVKVSP